MIRYFSWKTSPRALPKSYYVLDDLKIRFPGEGCPGMIIKMGRHYLADLYLCQNNLWKDPSQLAAEIAKTLAMKTFNWVVRCGAQPVILISSEGDATFILIQMFAEQRFLALDFFTWNPDFDLTHFSEILIEFFAPQVVAAETRFRAEHLN